MDEVDPAEQEALEALEQINPQKKQKGAALKRELQRRSLDSIMVQNPTNKDYRLDWDGFIHIVPANNRRTLFRYLAEKYVRDMKNQIINELADMELERIKQQLTERGAPDVVYNANAQLERSAKFKTDNPELIKKIYAILWLGVESKYGLDRPLPDEAQRSEPLVPVEEQVLEGLEKPYVANGNAPAASINDLANEMPTYTPATTTDAPFNIDTEEGTEPVKEEKPATTYPINKAKTTKDKAVEEVAV